METPRPAIAEIELALRQAISSERLHQHLRVFSDLHRQSGTADEREAARYVVDTVRGYGIDAEILEFDSLISWPLAGTLTVLDGVGRVVGRFRCGRARSARRRLPAASKPNWSSCRSLRRDRAR